MNAQAFIDAVQAMVGLPPDAIARLVELAPLMTDEERLDTVRQLTPVHTDIIQTSTKMLDEMDKGMQEMETAERAMKSAARKEAEAADTTDPNAILDASSPSA
jgi:glycerol-3-phosphate cytidylyltransferase-like family protein